MFKHLIRGLTALFLLVFALVPIIARADEGEWQVVLFEPLPEEQHEQILDTVSHTYYTSLWHYSGGFWENDDKTIHIKDDVQLDQEDMLKEALRKEVEFSLPVPIAVQEMLDQGKKVVISCQAGWNLEAENIFYLDKGTAQFRFDGAIMSFKAYPQINFLKEIRYWHYLPNLKKAIPFANPLYGVNSYSIFTRSGTHLGAANNYINPEDPLELPPAEEGLIHPSQILDGSGNLKDGFLVNVRDEDTGEMTMYDSSDLRIGAGTFENAGAVGIRFWYPLEITFYLAKELKDDLAVTRIIETKYNASQDVAAVVTVVNLGEQERTASLRFSIPGVTDEKQSVTIPAKGTQEVPFYFTTPTSGPITMTAEVNQERAFPETTYDNNAMSVQAAIETIPVITETANCNTAITWKETDSHIVSVGLYSYTCRHTFVYETKLSTSHKTDPATLKSGYGFAVNVDCSISTSMTANYGCASWGNNRKPDKTPTPPTKVEVRLPWKVTNTLGSQAYIVSLAKTSSNATISKFSPAPNPISEIQAKKIYTDIALAGTRETPKKHDFNIYISGGGVNGVEFCKNIKESITINGDMYMDDVRPDRVLLAVA